MEPSLSIINNAEGKRFETTVEGETAFVEYILLPNRIIFTHTEVPRTLEGKGIGSALAKHVLEYAKQEKLMVQPLCPFIAGYMKRHREKYEGLLAPGFHLG